MKEPARTTSLFVAAAGGVGLVLYLIFGPWLSAGRAADHRSDVTRVATYHHVTGLLRGIGTVTNTPNSNVVIVQLDVEYTDYFGQEKRGMVSQTGDQVPIYPGLNVYKDGHIEVGPDGQSYRYVLPVLLGSIASLFGLVILNVLVKFVAEEWRYYFHTLRSRREQQTQAEREQQERFEREASMTELQRRVQGYIDQLEQSNDRDVPDKAVLLERARSLFGQMSSAEPLEISQIRVELEILEKAITTNGTIAAPSTPKGA